MAVLATLSELKAVQKDLAAAKKANAKAFDAMRDLFKKHRMVGYKNIVKMMYGATPEELKDDGNGK